MSLDQARLMQRHYEENKQMCAALEAIAGFGSVNLNNEWEHGLRDIIRSMTDCARDALAAITQDKQGTP